MTICRYFLQGNCRFGDRCRFEHTEPEYSNRRNNYNNQDRYNQHYNSGNDSYYDSRYTYRKENNYNYPAYNSRNDPYHPDYGYHEKKQTQYSARYDDRDYRYNQQKPAYTSSQNKYEWTSENQKPSRSTSQYNTSTPKSKISFSFKDPDATPKHITPAKDLLMDEQIMFYAELIRKDAEEWEKGNIWPFASYSPKMNKSNFPGFYDFSYEELRLEACKAQKNNSYNLYVESVTEKVIEFKKKIKEMKDPTGDFFLIIEMYKNGEFPDMESINAQNFLKCSSASEEMIAEDLPQSTSASTFSFKTILDTNTAIKNSAAAFSFKTPSETDSAFKNPASAFSFKTPSETDSAFRNTASAFSFKVPLTTDAIKSSATAFSFKSASESVSGKEGPGGVYTLADEISLQDKEQFLASTFTLGKIPTIPPALSMCF